MAPLHSFYLAPEDWKAPFVLEGSEAHHLVRVLRLSPGHTVRLFDGLGRQGLFSIASLSKNRANLDRLREEHVPRPTVRCTLAAGFSKALRRGWFLEKAVELEAAALWFWRGDYSQAALPDAEKESWKAALRAGAKQCENPWLPELTALRGGIAEVAERARTFDRTYFLYEGDTRGRLLAREDLAESGDVLLIIGPEGGFSPREVDLLTGAGIMPVSLGDRILRWETAAILTLGMAWWARQRSGTEESVAAARLRNDGGQNT